MPTTESTTIRVKQTTRLLLRALAQKQGVEMGVYLHQLLLGQAMAMGLSANEVLGERDGA